MASFDIENLINNFSDLSITNNNNFNDEINEFMNIDIDHPEKYRYPHAIIYGFKLIGDNENNFFYIGSSVNPYVTLDNVNFRYLFISDFPIICIILDNINFILKVYFLFILLIFLLTDKYKSQILYLSPLSNLSFLSIS